jgi:hypothetical protein
MKRQVFNSVLLILCSIFCILNCVYGIYRQEITITNSTANSLTDYQVKISIDSSKATFWANVKSDGGDIRFKDLNNNLIFYWVESFDYTGKTASIWVKVPSIPASGSTKVYLDFGDSSLSSLSNIDNVMDTGLRYFYYDGTNFNTYRGNDIDTNIYHTWSGVVQIKGNSWEDQSDNVSIRWEGWVKAKGSGNHTFYCKSDDGQRLYVPSTNMIVDNWVAQAPTEKSATYSFDNVTTIKYEYFESSGGAEADLGWAPADGSGKVYPIPFAYLKCRKYNYSGGSFVEPTVSFGSVYNVRRIYVYVTKDNLGVEGVQVTLTNLVDSSTTTITTSFGVTSSFYVKDVGKYRLSFSKSGYSFVPNDIEIEVTGDIDITQRVSAYTAPSASEVQVINNPFTPTSLDEKFNKVRFLVGNSNNEEVNLKIYNINGGFVREISNYSNEISWDGKDNGGNIVRGGIYLYQLKLGDSVLKKGTVVVVK